jgi:hypothetical protein
MHPLGQFPALREREIEIVEAQYTDANFDL